MDFTKEREENRAHQQNWKRKGKKERKRKEKLCTCK